MFKCMKTQFFTNVLLCTVLGLAVLSSCSKRKPETGTGHGWGEAVFSVETLSVGQTDAMFQEAASGYEGAPFYGFVTSNVKSSLKNAITEKVNSISVNRHMLKTGVPAAQQVTGLRRGGKEYRYIVTGLTPDGRPYGTPAVASFTTKGEFTQSSVASIQYLGVSGRNHSISVEGFGGLYDLAILTREDAESYESDSALIQTLIDDTAPDPVSGDKTFNVGQIPAGEYVLIAYGVDEELDFEGCYNPTLAYAKSSFTVK